ncbi:alkaline ceramidase ydc1 [Spiromyces aspiralis]|uniref:Alkaline ceramidase ydc1 n=1 Tax=Spiromyces aspiralis TaxID=68401 RepID=A0ACC1HJR3_9FUNG|nr:alkaline ceramidase ydc1 [Spiromyces aspiralis]
MYPVVIYCTAIGIYCAFEARPRPKPRLWIPIGLFSYCLGVTLVYLYLRNPLFHEIAYGIEVLFYTGYCAVLQVRISRSKPSVYKDMLCLTWHAFFTFLSAFIIWNIDNVYCDRLRLIRKAAPAFIAPLFQFHALWHIGTGLGCYEAIVYQQLLRAVMLGKDHKLRVRYLLGIVPYITCASTENDRKLK